MRRGQCQPGWQGGDPSLLRPSGPEERTAVLSGKASDSCSLTARRPLPGWRGRARRARRGRMRPPLGTSLRRFLAAFVVGRECGGGHHPTDLTAAGCPVRCALGHGAVWSVLGQGCSCRGPSVRPSAHSSWPEGKDAAAPGPRGRPRCSPDPRRGAEGHMGRCRGAAGAPGAGAAPACAWA